jgi:3-deoxy-manno-octulosonate cytidylyltransferase (CMP-KDO synthetase)
VIEIQGKTLIEHVYRRVQRAESIERIVVATDDERIAAAVRDFDGEVVMTSSLHHSGTDRLAEAAAHLSPDALVVNIQGDEPLIEPDAIDRAVAAARHRDAEIVTLMTPLLAPDAIADPNRVKVVVDRNGFAMYFSRSPIPSVGPLFSPWPYVLGRFSEEIFQLIERLEIAERLEQLLRSSLGFV